MNLMFFLVEKKTTIILGRSTTPYTSLKTKNILNAGLLPGWPVRWFFSPAAEYLLIVFPFNIFQMLVFCHFCFKCLCALPFLDGEKVPCHSFLYLLSALYFIIFFPKHFAFFSFLFLPAHGCWKTEVLFLSYDSHVMS